MIVCKVPCAAIRLYQVPPFAVIMCRHSPLHHNTEVFAGFTRVRSVAVAAFDLAHYSMSVLRFVFLLFTLVSSRHKNVIDRFMCNTYVVRL